MQNEGFTVESMPTQQDAQGKKAKDEFVRLAGNSHPSGGGFARSVGVGRSEIYI